MQILNYFVLKILLCFLFIIQHAECRKNQKGNANEQLMQTLFTYRNMTVDPCVNFYKYACGNWKNIHGREQKKYSETLGLVDYKANYELTRILKRSKSSPHLSKQKFVQKVLNYYKTCTSLSLQSYDYMLYLHWLQKHAHIELPTLEEKRTPIAYDWLRLLATLRKYTLNGVFWELTVISYRNASGRWVLDLDKPVLNGGFNPFSKKELKSLLRSIDESILTYKSKNILSDIQEFEKKLYELYEVVDEEPYVYLSLRELKMSWLKRYLNILFKKKKIDTNLHLTVQNVNYLKSVWKFLNSYDHNFIGFYIILRFINYIKDQSPRELTPIDCIEHTRSHFPLAMNWLYEVHMNEQNLAQKAEDVRNLFGNLLKEFRQIIEQNHNNFDTEILQFLGEKVDNMRLKIGNCFDKYVIMFETGLQKKKNKNNRLVWFSAPE